MFTTRTAIDLFAGCGGMTYGLGRAGFKVVGALERDATAASTYRLNHPGVPLVEADIREVRPADWMKELGLRLGELDLLAGCPPCQGFSRLRTLNGTRTNKDCRNRLVLELIEFAEVLRPRALMMENVPGLAGKAVFKQLLTALRREGYVPGWKILDAADFGVPQRRRRLVLIAGRGFGIPFGSSKPNPKTVRMTIGSIGPPGKSGDYLHDLPERRTPQMQNWIAAVPKDGGGRLNLPERMQRECHRVSDGFRDVYGRMAWDTVAPTITGGCFNPSKGRFLHPEQDRNITMREAALLQTFPKSFRVPHGTTKTAAALMIGNALPPVFVRHHARSIYRALSALNKDGGAL